MGRRPMTDCLTRSADSFPKCPTRSIVAVMFTHEEIWRGIDRLAAHAQTSPSGLARRAGLDATTFNPSKRVSRDGSKPRWPSTESLAKALSAAHMDFAGFAALVAGLPAGTGDGLPSRMLNEDTGTAFDAGGRPSGDSWTRIPAPSAGTEDGFALTVSDGSMLPVYRPGDRLIVAPGESLRVGDRVVVKLRGGEAKAFELVEKGIQAVRLKPLNPGLPEQQVALSALDWMARIVWVSQ